MLWERIAANRRRTVVLFVVFFLLTLALSLSLLIVLGDVVIPAILMLVAVITAVVAVVAGQPAVLKYTGAREATADEHRQLAHLVEGLALAAQIPPPKCYVVNDEAPNAFATGLPGKGTICVTTGLLQKMDRQELEGVVAHEMAHIANHDTQVMTIAFVLAGLVSIASDLAMRSLRWGRYGGSRRRSRGSDGKGSGAQGLLLILAVAVIVLAPVAAKLLTMAVSRQREYLADAEAARLTRNPLGLASALRKIAEDPDPVDSASLATAHLFIVNPLRKGTFAWSWFSTHPPLQQRIARLEQM